MAKDIKVKISADSSQLDTAKKKIDSIKKISPIKLRLDLDTTNFNAQFNKIKNKRINIKANLDITDVDKKLANLSRQHNLNLKIDTNRINSELDNIAKKIDSLSNKSINLRVNSTNTNNNSNSGGLTSGLIGGLIGGSIINPNNNYNKRKIYTQPKPQQQPPQKQPREMYREYKSENKYSSSTQERLNAVSQSQRDTIIDSLEKAKKAYKQQILDDGKMLNAFDTSKYRSKIGQKVENIADKINAKQKIAERMQKAAFKAAPGIANFTVGQKIGEKLYSYRYNNQDKKYTMKKTNDDQKTIQDMFKNPKGSMNFGRILGMGPQLIRNSRTFQALQQDFLHNRTWGPSLNESFGNRVNNIVGHVGSFGRAFIGSTYSSNIRPFLDANRGQGGHWNNFTNRIQNNAVQRHFESSGLLPSLRGFRDSLGNTAKSVLKWGVVGAGLFALHSVINGVSSTFNTLVNVTKQMIATGMQFNAQKEMQTATYKAMAGYETNGNKEKASQISKSLYKNIETFAKDTIMETQGVAESVKQAMSYGINSTGAFSLVKQMSEFTGGSSDKLYRSTRAMSQAYSYGKLRAQEKNQLIESDVPIKQILDQYGEKVLGRKTPLSNKEVISWKDLAGAIDYATNKGGQYYGVIDSLSNTMTGKLAKLKDTVLITLGTTFEKVFNNIKNNYIDNLIKKIEEIGKTLEKVDLNSVFDEMSKGSNKVFKKLVEISGLEWSENPEKNAEAITKSLKKITKSTFDLGVSIVDTTAKFKDFFDKLNKWGDDWDNSAFAKATSDPKAADDLAKKMRALFPWNKEYKTEKEKEKDTAKDKTISAPTTGMLSSSYGDARKDSSTGYYTRKHAGVDYAVPKGTNVNSVYGGKVSRIGYDEGGYGKYMDVYNSATGLTERFAHLSSTLLKVGDKVAKGQKVAQSGDSGSPGSFHLHYEIRNDGNAKGGGFGYTGTIDPFKQLKNTTTKKKTTSSTTSKNTKYDKYFEKYGDKYGVDSELLKAIADVESNFNPNAKSGAGAMGLMQFMPGTWAAYGSGSAYNAENSINAGGKYMSNLLNQYGGDTEKALAAYNAGSGTVDKAIKKYGDNWLSKMPKETRDYVPKVLGKAGNISDNITASPFEIDKENMAKETEIFKAQWEQAQKLYEENKTDNNFNNMTNAYNKYKKSRDDYNKSYLEDLDAEKALVQAQTEDINQRMEIQKLWQNTATNFVTVQKQKYDLATSKFEGNKQDKSLKTMADDSYANYQSARDNYNQTWLKGDEQVKAILEGQIEDQQRLNNLINEQKNLINNVVSEYKNLFKFSDVFQKQKIEKFSPGKLERKSNKNFKNWSKWADNLNKLESQGISSDIMYELRSMGVEGLGVTEGLLRSSSEQRNRILSNVSGISNIALNQASATFRHEVEGNIFVKSESGDFALTKEQVLKLIDDSLNIGSNRFLR